LGPIDGELLGDIDVLAATVVALSGITLGVLVGQHRALAFEHGDGHEVLGSDHLERPLLALELKGQHLGDLRIDLGEGAVEEVLWKLYGHGCDLISGGSGKLRARGAQLWKVKAFSRSKTSRRRGTGC